MMSNPSGEDRAPPGRHNDILIAGSGSERSRFDAAFLTLMEMHVRWWSVLSWRQRTVDSQDGLTFGVTYPAHPQDLPSVPVLKLQKVIHD